MASASISSSSAWTDLEAHKKEIEKLHLRDLLNEEKRCKSLIKEFDNATFDFSRQLVTEQTIAKLLTLAKEAKLKEKIESMFAGKIINETEKRPVLHVALRAPRDEVIELNGKNVVNDVWEVLDKIKSFSESVRSGEKVGITGKKFKSILSIGIGGSYLGPLFVHNAIKTDPECIKAAAGLELRFLANVDPIDCAIALDGLDPETTLVIIVSKTFTTSETMLNARTVKNWLVSKLGNEAVFKHMVAVSTNLKLVENFGIDLNNVFSFWDWVGGRFSVSSAVGVLPLSVQYGFDIVKRFLDGAAGVDKHFRNAEFENNIPVLLGLLSVWNVSFFDFPSRAILPYNQALSKFPLHIQQLSMESNGKSTSMSGEKLPYQAGEIDFGESGTNGQHSFYQLIHQGRIIPCDFIGYINSQQPVSLPGETVNNHDELMCNFFAQADALAYGKTKEQLTAEGVPENLVPHKLFTGNRPSLSMLFTELNPYTTGQLLALYEHRIAVQGFVWQINSFDQWGVELGKILATKIRKEINQFRNQNKNIEGFNYSTSVVLSKYLNASS